MHRMRATSRNKPTDRSTSRFLGIRGFSLVEALVVMAISAIGLVIGVPSYRSLMEHQRASSAMHLLTAHMASARNTAISYRIPTVVCPSNRAGGCRMDGDWSQGWLMFFDADGNRQPDAREDVLRDENAPIHPTLRLVSSSGRPQLRYLPDGRSAGSNLSVRLCRDDVLLGQVIVNNVGRVRSEMASGSKPCNGSIRAVSLPLEMGADASSTGD